MSEFIYAAELKKTFRCSGHFYRLNIEGSDPLLCRSMLEITSLPREAVGVGTNPDDLFSSNHTSEGVVQSLPNAVVIMMNPGSSRPTYSEKSTTLSIKSFSTLFMMRGDGAVFNVETLIRSIHKYR